MFTMPKSFFFLSAILLLTYEMSGAALSTGPFTISSIVSSAASSCSATDATITLTIDFASPGTAPYDVQLLFFQGMRK